VNYWPRPIPIAIVITTTHMLARNFESSEAMKFNMGSLCCMSSNVILASVVQSPTHAFSRVPSTVLGKRDLILIPCGVQYRSESTEVRPEEVLRIPV
jgi:hypothetical protein